MLICFLISFFGMLSAYRIAIFHQSNRMFASNELTKIGTGMLVIAFSLMLAKISHARLGIAVVVLNFAIFFAPFVRREWRERRFRSGFEAWLSHLVLLMKTGLSFRASLAQAVSESPISLRTRIQEVADLVVFSQQSINLDSSFTHQVVKDLRFADAQAHLSIRRLEDLRDRLRIESEFRRRSKQAKSQVRIQAIVLGILYLVVFGFTVRFFGWRDFQEIYLLSLTLFAVGVGWLLSLGGRQKWKI